MWLALRSLRYTTLPPAGSHTCEEPRRGAASDRCRLSQRSITFLRAAAPRHPGTVARTPPTPLPLDVPLQPLVGQVRDRSRRSTSPRLHLTHVRFSRCAHKIGAIGSALRSPAM